MEKGKLHKYIRVVLGEFSQIEIEVSGSRDLISKLDIAIHNIIEKEEEIIDHLSQEKDVCLCNLCNHTCKGIATMCMRYEPIKPTKEVADIRCGCGECEPCKIRSILEILCPEGKYYPKRHSIDQAISALIRKEKV